MVRKNNSDVLGYAIFVMNVSKRISAIIAPFVI
jgi:hypothetical protein